MPMDPSAGLSSSTFNPDQLIARNADGILSKKITLLLAENRARGALLGKITIGAIAGVAAAGNTGNGALAGVALAAAGVPKVGVYRVVCVEAAANSGRFLVEDPDGVLLGQYVVAAAAFNNQIAFTIADGAADFLAGDSFLITIAAGSGKYKLSAAAAVDGSQVPVAVLAQDCDATAADKEAEVFVRGWFNESKLVLGAGHTANSTRDALALLGIILVPAVAA